MHRLRQSYRLFLFLKRDETRQRSLVYDLIIYAISPVDDLTQGRNERAELALPLTRMPDNARLDTSRLNLAQARNGMGDGQSACPRLPSRLGSSAG